MKDLPARLRTQADNVENDGWLSAARLMREAADRLEVGFFPDYKLEPSEALSVHLSLALNRHVPDWPGATDEQLDAVATELLSNAEKAR
jgi:hypothetical protein